MFWLLKLFHDTHSLIHKRLSCVSINAIIFLENGSEGLCVSCGVCSLFEYISTSINSWFHDSDRERGLKKKEEVSLGSRIVNNICYHSEGESGQQDWKNQIHQWLTHTVQLGRAKWRRTEK